MRRWFVVIIAVVAAAVVAPPPSASAGDAPIGRLGDTLRVKSGNVIADVTVHDVLPSAEPPGWTYNGQPGVPYTGSPWRAGVTVHTIKASNPFVMATDFTFDGVTPGADAYRSKHTYAPDALETALQNAPTGSTVNGGVYWEVYRGLVSNVVLLDAKTGVHLAQWNL